MTETAHTTIYETIGGEDALIAVVDDLYLRILADPTLKGFFTSVNMSRLKGRQVEFFGAALGGPMTYTGGSMRAVHEGMAITSEQFAAVAAHLTGALLDAGVPKQTTDEIIGLVAPMADDIVTA